MEDLKVNNYFRRKNSSMENLLGFGVPPTARFFGGGPSIQMPEPPDFGAQMAMMQSMMSEQRAASEAQWERRQEEVRQQEQQRLEMEQTERERQIRLAEEREDAVARAEEMAINEAEGIIVDDGEEEEDMVYGFYGLYDMDDEEEEYDPNQLPE